MAMQFEVNSEEGLDLVEEFYTDENSVMSIRLKKRN
jgi:hypothetical protein